MRAPLCPAPRPEQGKLRYARTPRLLGGVLADVVLERRMNRIAAFESRRAGKRPVKGSG